MNRAVSNTDLKTLVIGLDGGNLQVFKRLADQGHMPFFASILKQGTSGELRSVVPPLTAPAWSTFMTGKNPGKHGVFDFFNYENSASPVHVVNSTSLKADTIWSMLSRADKRVGVVNVPMTYPPQPVNGTMIADLLTPGIEQTFTYPPTLYDELRSELGEYVLAVSWRGKKIKPFLRELRHCTRQRGKYVCYLMDRNPWDLFTVVFSETDWLQHVLWSYLDPTDHRNNDSEVEKLIFDYFRLLDEILCKIHTTAGRETHLFFVSDHGFGPAYKWLYINTWLNQQGWLTYHRRQLFIHNAKYQIYHNLRRQTWAVWFVHWLRRNMPIKKTQSRVGYNPSILSSIDWSGTKAFCVLWGEQGIRINLKGREHNGSVSPGREYEELRDAIIAKLQDLRDSETGAKIVERVWKREELYTGPYVERAADIVFHCGGKYIIDSAPAKRLMEEASWFRGTGHHRLEGLFVAHGPDIKAGGSLNHAQLQDIAPTVLFSLGQPIPADIDGRILSEIYEPRWLSQHQPQIIKPDEMDKIDQMGDYSEKEEREVLERLRGLGYID